jgi:hypothetical protein
LVNGVWLDYIDNPSFRDFGCKLKFKNILIIIFYIIKVSSIFYSAYTEDYFESSNVHGYIPPTKT